MIPLIVLVLAAPAKSAPKASLPNRAAVFVVATDGKDAEAGRTEVKLTKALDDAKVNLTDLESLFPPADRNPAGTKLLQEGKDAYDNLDLEASQKKYQEALEFFTQHPDAADAKSLADSHFFVGVLAIQNGGKSMNKKAQEEFTRALLHNPDLDADPKIYGADIKKVFDKAKQEVAARATGQLAISSTPGGAEATLRGKSLGLTPIADAPTVPAGRHIVTFSRAGFEPTAVLADVTNEGGKADATLKAAAGYGEAREVASSLVASGVGAKGKVPGGAQKVGEVMKSRFLVVAAMEGATGKLEVWDVEGGGRLSNVELADDASFAVAATKVKQFMANPSPLKEVEVAIEEPGAKSPVYKKWWFWTAVGVVVVGGTTAGVVAASSSNGRPFNVVLGLP